MTRRLTIVQQRVTAALETGLVAAARCAHRELDAAVARADDHDGVPACSAGCSYCCHVHVEATHAEVLAIADYLSSTDVTALIATLSERPNSTHEDRWAARIPCALLGRDGRCTVYEVRPLRCRAFHSYSADVCREAFAGPTEPDPLLNLSRERACDDVELAFERALEARSISTEPVLLEEGLLKVLLSAQRA